MPKKADAGNVDNFIRALLQSPAISPSIADHRLIPGAPPEYAQNRVPWPTAISSLLRDRGINLYSHQALATDHIRAGHSIVAATPTASGKSLIYNLPVLEKHLVDPEARALYLFPLKALAQDQIAAFNSLCLSWPEEARPTAALYDGDTSDHFRRKIRNKPPTALITNPEMLHLAILPHHEKWASFLANLSHVIVDEAHTYRGVFGSHMAQVFRRLNRVAGLYGAEPSYIFCTATLGNPAELARNLMDGSRTPALINKSGAPRGARHFMFLNPEAAASTCAIEVLRAALEHNLRAIVYCQSRRMTELVSLWAGAQSGPWKNRISAYRAGFLAEERRNIEARMASGELLAVVSTSALELGIDIGGLDVCILVGYPGTVMQTLQRGGRVGRAQQNSAVILVAGEDALDQYFMRHPDDFFQRPPEKAVVNPDNEVICARHMECAATELPLERDEPWLQGPGARTALETLRAEGRLLLSADGSQWLASRKAPHRHVDLRGCGSTYTIEDTKGKIIGMVDGFRAWRETHPGAVYLHHGKSYVIDQIDEGRMRITASPAKVAWFTRSRGNKATDILEEYERISLGRCLIGRGRLRITEKITGYEKRAVSGNRLLAIAPLHAPPQVFETEGIWFVIPDGIRKNLEDRFIHFMGSIHAMEHAIIGLLPLEVMADRNDFGGISTPLHVQLGNAAVFVYDSFPGGAGLSAAAFGEARGVLESTLKAIRDCPCDTGCPSCVHSPKCGSGNRPISKEGAIALLRELLAPGNEGDKLLDALRISPAPDRIAPKIRMPEPPEPEEDINSESAGNPPPSPAFIPSLPPARYIVFDVETRRSAAEVGGWGKAGDMGVSVAVAYDSQEDRFFSYGQDELPDLLERMAVARLVVGFNSSRFDYAVLQPFASKMARPMIMSQLPTLDLLTRVNSRLGYRVALDNLGKATLGRPKLADGLQALRWWKEGKLDKIREYCQEDVAITRDIYLYGLKNGYLLFTNKAGASVRVDVDFDVH